VTRQEPGGIDLARALRPFHVFGVGPLPADDGPRLVAWLRFRCDQLRSLALEFGIPASPVDLERGVEAVRARHGVATRGDAGTPLHDSGLGEEELAVLLEAEWLHTALKQVLSNAEAVQRAFAAHRAFFETVEVAGLPFDERSEAEALLHELRGGRARLPVSIPPDSRFLPEPAVTGYMGLVTRADLPAEAAEALFSDRPQEFIGPVAYDRRHWVYQMLLPKRPEFNCIVYEYCEDLLVEEALNARAQRSSGGT